MAKVFISYKRNVDPDSAVATEVFESLRKEHDVFIDTTIQVGERWAERIQNEIKRADYLVVFLSEHSVHSEMVIAEIDIAHHNEKMNGRPVILPVRLSYTEPFVYPLSVYLNPLQWAVWKRDFDTPRLIDELREAISGGVLPVGKAQKDGVLQPAKEDVPTAFANMGSPEGTMPPDSRFYIERHQDRIALKTLDENTGATVVIKGPRQMGKSSLLNRLIVKAREKGIRVAFIDFQLVENSAIEDADVFYRRFCGLISNGFGMEDRSNELWNVSSGNLVNTTRFISEYVLQEAQEMPILLAMDEVERMFASSFRSDFFSMLRTWHNNRANDGRWRNFYLALVTSTEPYQFIADLNQSPFNVGEVLELEDFTPEQVSELNNLHHNPLIESQYRKLNYLLGGHPYLTRKAFYLVASGRYTFMEMLNNIFEDDGPFGDHLRNILFRISDQKKLKKGLVQVINPHRYALIKYFRRMDERTFFRLRGAGLVKRIGNKVVPRNELYAEYFRRRLSG